MPLRLVGGVLRELGGDMRYLSLFSGIEAASIAWAPLGWEPVAFSEIDPFCNAVLERHYPDVPNLGDVKEIDWAAKAREWRRDGRYPDLVVGGSPCQSWSIAGKRTGLEGESGLMWEYVRCVRDVRPRWFVWENVRGALSSSKGEDFRRMLAAMDELGYGMAWRVLDAQFFGLPQRRERLLLVGHIGGPEGPCSVLFDEQGLRGAAPTHRGERQRLLAEGGAGGAGEAGGLPPLAMRVRCGKPGGGKGPLIQTDLAGAATASNDQTLFQPADVPVLDDPSRTVPGYIARSFTPREYERLQGIPDDWTLVPYRRKAGAPEKAPTDAARRRAVGNSMPVPMMRWAGERIAAYDAHDPYTRPSPPPHKSIPGRLKEAWERLLEAAGKGREEREA